jgi:alanine racemase
VRHEDRGALLEAARSFLDGHTSPARFSQRAVKLCAATLGRSEASAGERGALDALYAVASRHAAGRTDPATIAFASDGEMEAAARAALEALTAADGPAEEPAVAPQSTVRATTPPGGASPGARITIDPEAVARNYRRLASWSRAECGAVVKADAYGLGIGAIAPALARAGCRTFFVALPQEGLALRALLPEAVIYVLNGTLGDPRPLVEANLRPFISSPDALAEWPQDVPFALNVDTGMNRLGLTVAEALETTHAAPALIASHFACADTPRHPQNALQEAAFSRVRAAFGDTPASFANSAALMTRPHTHHQLTRPGIALYGGVAAGSVQPLEPAVRLEARVVQVRKAQAGEAVGYGAAERLKGPTRLAIASAGYADGYLRASGGTDETMGAPAFVNGTMTRLVGRVSMDLVTVDVTDARCQRGDMIELFGPNVPLEAVARRAGTIGYELLTGLSGRAERRYGPL